MRPSNSRKHNFSGWSFLPTIVYRLQQSSVDMWHESFCWCWSEKTANAPMENLQKCLQPANVTRGRLAGCSIFSRMRWWCLFWYKKCTPGGIRTHGLSLRRRKQGFPPIPLECPQTLAITAFLTNSIVPVSSKKHLFYPSAIRQRLDKLIGGGRTFSHSVRQN